jgi:hypothetical protein
MKKLVSKKCLFVLVLGLLIVSAASGAEYDVSVTNLTHGFYFTPLLITAHSGDTHLFQLGENATPDLRAMAEGGDISGLSIVLGGPDEDTVENPAGGLLGPGESVQGININTDQTGNAYLSLVAMLLPTNDGFVGLDAIHLPMDPGTYTYYLNGYDAGTEANDEIINGGGAPGVPGVPAAPGGDGGINGTGVTFSEVNTTVHIHRGTLGDIDPMGGFSDLDTTIHRWLNPVAKVIVEIN